MHAHQNPAPGQRAGESGTKGLSDSDHLRNVSQAKHGRAVILLPLTTSIDLCSEITEETKMRKHRRANVTEALQEVPGEGAEQASPIAEVSTDASEEENAGTEMLQYKVDDVIEVVQEAKGAEQAGRMLQKWSDNLDAIIQSSSVLAEVTQSISREWVNFTRERMEQNLSRFESLLRCRTPQDLAAVESEFLRDNLESFLEYARRIAETSIQVADEATKRTAEAVEAAKAA